MNGVPNANDWRALVYRHAGINNSVRVMLLYLADNMRADRTVSIPQSRIAEALGVNPRRVKERIADARSAGLIDTVRQGRPGITAMYQGLFPDLALGADVRTNQTAQHGAVERTKRTPLYGADGGPPISKREPSETVSFGEAAGGSTVNAPRRPHACNEEEPRVDIAPARSAGGETAEGGSVVSSADRANRKALIDALQDYVRAHTEALDDDAWLAASDRLDALLDDVEDGLAAWAANYWTFPRNCSTSRYAAGTQLNKLINTYRSEAA